jgi:hypothetical protein
VRRQLVPADVQDPVADAEAALHASNQRGARRDDGHATDPRNCGGGRCAGRTSGWWRACAPLRGRGSERKTIASRRLR